jgi:hypothetical protein
MDLSNEPDYGSAKTTVMATLPRDGFDQITSGDMNSYQRDPGEDPYSK